MESWSNCISVLSLGGKPKNGTKPREETGREETVNVSHKWGSSSVRIFNGLNSPRAQRSLCSCSSRYSTNTLSVHAQGNMWTFDSGKRDAFTTERCINKKKHTISHRTWTNYSFKRTKTPGSEAAFSVSRLFAEIYRAFKDVWAVQTVSTDRQTHRVAFPASLSLLHPSGASLWQWKPTCQSF